MLPLYIFFSITSLWWSHQSRLLVLSFLFIFKILKINDNMITICVILYFAVFYYDLNLCCFVFYCDSLSQFQYIVFIFNVFRLSWSLVFLEIFFCLHCWWCMPIRRRVAVDVPGYRFFFLFIYLSNLIIDKLLLP